MRGVGRGRLRCRIVKPAWEKQADGGARTACTPPDRRVVTRHTPVKVPLTVLSCGAIHDTHVPSMTKSSRRILVSFADSRLRPSARRLARQAAAMRSYGDVVIMDERDLEPAFRARHRDRLRRGTRGFGYWVWKPEVLRHVHATCADGDILHYVDIGCHLHPPGRVRLEEYCALAADAECGILAFALRLPEGHVAGRWHGHPPSALAERFWSKGDLLDHFGVRHRKDVVDTPQVIATQFVMRCGPAVRAFLDRWAAVWADDFTLVDDTPSRSENLPGFIEHRHDQSVFSVLCKLGGVPTLSAAECEFPAPDGRADWAALASFPVHARRDLRKSWAARGRSAASRVIRGLLHPTLTVRGMEKR